MEYTQFSSLLRRLQQQAGIKNQTLANAVRYDVSYISKWCNGKSLPSERYAREIIAAIAEVAASSGSEDAERLMLEEYGCTDREELARALQEMLAGAYEADKAAEQKGQERLQCYPVLRSLQVARKIQAESRDGGAGIIDFFALDHPSRLLVSGIVDMRFYDTSRQPESHFSLGIDTAGAGTDDAVYDAISLVHMLTSYSGMDFTLYALPDAAGKCIYAARDRYSISGMLLQNGECLSVIESRDSAYVDTLYQNLRLKMDPERLIFKKVQMEDLLKQQLYLRSLLANENRWVLGHVTEHLLPTELFEQLAGEDQPENEPLELRENRRKCHLLSRKLLCGGSARVVLYDSALALAAATGEVDFYNQRVMLDMEQRKLLFDDLERMAMSSDVRIELVQEGFSTDFRYITNPCLFLSDSFCCLRLENGRYEDNLLLLQNLRIKELFDRFFECIWTGRQDVVVIDPAAIRQCIRRYRDSLYLQ